MPGACLECLAPGPSRACGQVCTGVAWRAQSCLSSCNQPLSRSWLIARIPRTRHIITVQTSTRLTWIPSAAGAEGSAIDLVSGPKNACSGAGVEGEFMGEGGGGWSHQNGEGL